ncbi:MAG: HAMP domain-containing sensor histidine kinase [Myxococcota bacterium]
MDALRAIVCTVLPLDLLTRELPYPDPVDQRRAGSLRAAILVAPLANTPFALFHLTAGVFEVGVGLVLSLAPVALAWWWLHRGRLGLAAQVFCASIYAMLALTAPVTGGVFGASPGWFAIVVLVAASVSSTASTLVWLGITSLTCVFLAVGVTGVPEPIQPWINAVAVASNLGFIAVIGMVGLGMVLAADRLTDSLAEAQAAAHQSNAEKGAFLARMSHQFRTPLTTVMGYTEDLEEVAREASAREDLKRIRLASSALLAILDDVLDLARDGDLELSPGPINLDVLEDELRATVEPLAHRRGNKFEVLFPELPFVPRLDEGRLRQVLLNLLGNACKFTEDGRIVLRAVRLDGHWIRFEVSDTGIGMNPEQLSRVFAPFEQATPDTAQKYGGTGLGLAICRRLLEAMGGHIQMDSKPGKGTMVWVDVPGDPT